MVRISQKEYIVQVNVPQSMEKRYIHLNNLLHAFQNDPDLVSLPQMYTGLIMQTIFISTGCDFVSYFKSIGKSTILNIFFQYSEFICGSSRPGCIHQTAPENKERGFLSFIRLVGCCYFKKHLASFVPLYGHETPLHLFNSIETCPQKHDIWLKKIRDVVSERITSEEERVPMYSALWRHWLRSCWVSQLWQNSHLSDVYSSLPPPQTHGWALSSEGTFSINWEAPDVQEKISMNIEILTKGCHCKTGCKSKVCGCRKKLRHCGPGCDCHGCTNLPSVSIHEEELQADQSNSDTESDTESSSDEMMSDTEIITDEFIFSVPEIV